MTPLGRRIRNLLTAAILAWGLVWLVWHGVAHADDGLALLRRVNSDVNRSIRYEAEPDPRRDVVRFGPSRGDCEDYAETKRLRLIASRWPRRDLSVQRVTYQGQCHAVLVATDPTGRRWVLDNRTSGIETIEQTGRRYRWNGC